MLWACSPHSILLDPDPTEDRHLGFPKFWQLRKCGRAFQPLNARREQGKDTPAAPVLQRSGPQLGKDVGVLGKEAHVPIPEPPGQVQAGRSALGAQPEHEFSSVSFSLGLVLVQYQFVRPFSKWGHHTSVQTLAFLSRSTSVSVL